MADLKIKNSQRTAGRAWDWSNARTSIPTVVQIVYCRLCLGLPLVPSVDVPNQMVSNIIANLHTIRTRCTYE